MVDKNENMTDLSRFFRVIRERVGLQLLLYFQIAACCISLICVSKLYPEYHIFYNPDGWLGAVAITALLALISVLFVFAEFSFGYLVGFYLFTMITGYLWLNHFSEFSYNHRLTGLSALASTIAFLLPALFIRAPVRQIWTLSTSGFERLLNAILLLATATVIVGAVYNFRLVQTSEIYTYRETLSFPRYLNYLIGTTTSALLPFAFACFVERKNPWRAGAAVVLLLLFYPIILNKLVLFSPAWIIVMALFSKLFEAKITAVLSLFGLLATGIVLFALFKSGAIPDKLALPYFSLVNLRMIAIPSMAMDYYNDFFSRNDLMYFCQIQLLKSVISCPYQEPLAVVIYNAFGIGGYLNASLFATEGVASVGAMFAPVTVFVCGLVIALGNRLSAGLPPRFILISGAIFAHILLNVPLATTLVTHGLALLFLLWYLTPRTMYDAKSEPESRSLAQPDPNDGRNDTGVRNVNLAFLLPGRS